MLYVPFFCRKKMFNVKKMWWMNGGGGEEAEGPASSISLGWGSKMII